MCVIVINVLNIEILNVYLYCRYPIDNGTPVFIVFIAGGWHEKDFLEETI